MDPFSQRVADILFRTRPEWSRHARLEQAPGAEHGFLLLELPPPSSGRPAIWLDSDGGELTVGFDRWTRRFPGEPGDTLPAAILCIEGILDESMVVATTYQGPDWVAALVPAGHLPKQPYGGRVVVRSWTGRHDSTVAE